MPNRVYFNDQGTPFATPDITAERVDEIYEIMREGRWKPGPSTREYAEKWGISESRIRQISAEAWRRVCHEADDPEKMRPEIAGMLRKNLHRADEHGNFRAVGYLADTWSKVIGARAPERHEHAVVIAQFESLNNQGKIEWLEQRIKKLEEARLALLEAKEDT